MAGRSVRGFRKTSNRDCAMVIIDPPPIMYGPPEAIQAWLDELANMPQDAKEVKQAIKQAQEWLKESPAP